MATWFDRVRVSLFGSTSRSNGTHVGGEGTRESPLNVADSPSPSPQEVGADAVGEVRGADDSYRQSLGKRRLLFDEATTTAVVATTDRALSGTRLDFAPSTRRCPPRTAVDVDVYKRLKLVSDIERNRRERAIDSGRPLLAPRWATSRTPAPTTSTPAATTAVATTPYSYYNDFASYVMDDNNNSGRHRQQQQQPTTWTPLAGPSEAELSAGESERKLNETNARINAILERLQNVSLHRQEVDAKATVRSRDEEIKLTQERVAALTRERMAGTGVPPTPSLSEEKEEQTELEDEILRDFEHQDDVARERYLDAINANNGGEIMCSHERDRLDLTRRDLSTLHKQGWLNDEVINCYVALLQDRDLAWRRDGDPGGRRRPRCHFFNTFFYNKLFQDSHKYTYLERWTRAKKLAKVHGGKTLFDSCDKIIAPIHKGNHWCCAVIDLEAQAFVYYDSFKSEDHDCLEAMKQFAIDEARTRENTHISDVESWPVLFPQDIPEQRNGWDCGVFAATYAEVESRCMGRPKHFGFDQRDMPDLRVRMCVELLDQKVGYVG